MVNKALGEPLTMSTSPTVPSNGLVVQRAVLAAPGTPVTSTPRPPSPRDPSAAVLVTPAGSVRPAGGRATTSDRSGSRS